MCISGENSLFPLLDSTSVRVFKKKIPVVFKSDILVDPTGATMSGERDAVAKAVGGRTRRLGPEHAHSGLTSQNSGYSARIAVASLPCPGYWWAHGFPC